jgi:hypothetical protein
MGPAGMFFWIKVHWERHKLAKNPTKNVSDTILMIEEQLYLTALA